MSSILDHFLATKPAYCGGLVRNNYVTEEYSIRMHFGRYTFEGVRGYGWSFLYDNLPLEMSRWQRFRVNFTCRRLMAKARRSCVTHSELPLYRTWDNSMSEIMQAEMTYTLGDTE